MVRMKDQRKLCLSMDQTGHPFAFKVHYRFSEHRTWIGVFLSILIFPVVLSYGILQFNALVYHQNSNVIVTQELNYFEVNEFEITTQHQNFQVAFALIDYENPDDTDNIVDEGFYGETKAFYKKWGDPEVQGTYYEELESRLCTRSELQLEGSNEKFYPYNSAVQQSVETYAGKLMCFDEDLVVYGSYSSIQAQNLAIQFVKCDPQLRTCASEEELAAFLKRKSIITLQNTVLFDPNGYEEDNKMIRESYLIYHPVNSQFRVENINQIQVANVTTEDSIVVGMFFDLYQNYLAYRPLEIGFRTYE